MSILRTPAKEDTLLKVIFLLIICVVPLFKITWISDRWDVQSLSSHCWYSFSSIAKQQWCPVLKWGKLYHSLARVKWLFSALCRWQSWPQVFPASLFLPSIKHGDSDAWSFLPSTTCQLQYVNEKSVFVFLSPLLKKFFCNYQSSCIKGEKRHKDLKRREMFMPEHFKIPFACFIDHQIILHSIIQMKCSWVQLITV